MQQYIQPKTRDLADAYKSETTLVARMLMGHHNDVSHATPLEIQVRNNVLSDPFTRHSLREALYRRGTAFRPNYVELGEALSSPKFACETFGIDNRRYITDSYEI
jgi:hypothetical protein